MCNHTLRVGPLVERTDKVSAAPYHSLQTFGGSAEWRLIRTFHPRVAPHFSNTMLAATSSSFSTLQHQSSSLDYWSGLWRLFWLRKNTPRESPGLTAMVCQRYSPSIGDRADWLFTQESNADIDIIVFPEQAVSEDSDGSIRAQTNRSLPYSIISTGMLERLGIEDYPPCQKAAVTHRNVQHFPNGKVTLRWHKEESGKSHSEVFFVVDTHTALVILGATAFPNSSQSSGGNIFPVGVAAQTAGTLIQSWTVLGLPLTLQG